MKSVIQVRSARQLAVLALSGLFLTTYSVGQSPSGTSSIVSPAPHKPAADNADSAALDVPESSAGSANINVDPASLLPDLPAVSTKDTTLIGGTIAHVDRIRDRLNLAVFGGGKVTATFDPRTKVYLGANEATVADLKQGDRVYLETVLDGSSVFARAIRVKGATSVAESQGTVLSASSDHSEFTMRDKISPEPIRIQWDASTKFAENGRPSNASSIVPGSLISVVFSPQNDGHGLAREISVLAVPGSKFTFVGEVTHVDLRSGLVVLTSSTDNKTYEIYLDSSIVPDENLHAGAVVTVLANFEGSRYVARNLTIDHEKK